MILGVKMKKQILMLTSTWDSNYSRDVISGILERIGAVLENGRSRGLK